MSGLAGHALILGWAGSTPRQLRTIAGLYRSLGLTPIAVAPDVFRAMALPGGWRREGHALAARLLATIDRTDGIVVHAFSNAGFWSYAATLTALGRHPRGGRVLDRIGALVLDSAPGFPPRIHPSFAARASTMAMMPLLLRALRRPPAITHPLLDRPLRAFMRLWAHASPRQLRFMETSLAVVRDSGEWPVLFLCSSADRLVPIEHVEAFAATLGDRARVLRWEDSAHVRHMVAHRQAYFDAVRDHIERALRGR